MGTSVFHIGWQHQRLTASTELTVLTRAMYTARSNAMARMEAEAKALGAEGIVSVDLQWRPHGVSPEHIEFVAVGTAIRHHDPGPRSLHRHDGRPFTSHLSVQAFYTLLGTGHAPVAFVLGNCVWHVAAQGVVQTMKQFGQNAEMPQWTQAYYEARETAMLRLQVEAERDGASGIVEVHQRTSEWVWGVHTLEFYAAGTSVRRFGEPQQKAPTGTLPLV